MNASNTIKLEIVASTEHKARVYVYYCRNYGNYTS